MLLRQNYEGEALGASRASSKNQFRRSNDGAPIFLEPHPEKKKFSARITFFTYYLQCH